LSENFQDWPSTRTIYPNPLDCNKNNRLTDFNWKNMRIHRPSGEAGANINIYLVSAEIQHFCDTQSGTYYTIDSLINTSDRLGPSNPVVSVGNITLLDSANNIFPTDPVTGERLRRGALIVGQLPSISLIQYTTSSFGSKRGFTLEYSLDRGKTWIVLRKEHGKSLDSTLTTSGYMLANSPKGIVWEENVELNDAMLRFTINANQPQIVRIHDLRIFGVSPLREDCDDSEFEAIYGVNWGEWMGVEENLVTGPSLSFDGNTLRISGNPKRTEIINLAGQVIDIFGNDVLINLSGLSKGIYFVKCQDGSGMISRLKVKI